MSFYVYSNKWQNAYNSKYSEDFLSNGAPPPPIPVLWIDDDLSFWVDDNGDNWINFA
ncbi:MAG: hypothetical protein ACTSR1_00295 [Candidatus Heimdallarchaeota archaeon]